MILPNKYVEPSQSLFFVGAFLLKLLSDKKYSIIDFWLLCKKESKGKIVYNKYVQSLIYLYSVGALGFSKEGYIYNENYKN